MLRKFQRKYKWFNWAAPVAYIHVYRYRTDIHGVLWPVQQRTSFFYQLGLCTARRLRACCFSNNSVSTKCTLLVCFCKTLHEALYVQSVIVIYCTSICLSRVASSVSKRVNERQCVKKHFEFSYTKFVNKIPIGSISVLLQYSRNPRRNNIHCESKNQTPNSCP